MDMGLQGEKKGIKASDVDALSNDQRGTCQTKTLPLSFLICSIYLFFLSSSFPTSCVCGPTSLILSQSTPPLFITKLGHIKL